MPFGSGRGVGPVFFSRSLSFCLSLSLSSASLFIFGYQFYFNLRHCLFRGPPSLEIIEVDHLNRFRQGRQGTLSHNGGRQGGLSPVRYA